MISVAFEEWDQIHRSLELPYSTFQSIVQLVVTRRRLKAQDILILGNSECFFEMKPEDTSEYLHIATIGHHDRYG